MKKFSYLCRYAAKLIILSALLSCRGFDSMFTEKANDAFKAGASVPLPKAGGGKVVGTMVDVNGDGIPDGIDLNGDGIPEILFRNLVVGQSSGLDLNGDGASEYYLSVDYQGNFYISTTNPGGNSTSGNVAVTTDTTGTPTGFNSSGGTAIEDNTLQTIYNDSTPPNTNTNPGGTFTGAQTVTLTCSDNVACNAIAYTTDGSTPSFTGGSTVVTGNNTQVTIGGTATLQWIVRDSKGNVSTVQSANFTITGSGDTTPPANITGFSALAGDTQITLNWSNPVDLDFAGVKILRKTGSYPANNSDGTVVHNGTGTTANDTGLINNTQYYYAAFSFDAVPNYASGVQVTQTPVPTLWAKTVSAGSNITEFLSVALDSSGNVYAAGRQVGTGSYTYGSGVSVAGTFVSDNIVLVKYNSSGVAQWAKSVTAGSSSSRFNSVALDSSGNIYTAGYQSGTGSYTYGPGVSVNGTSANPNVVLVKYNASGVAQWARSVTAGSSESKFNSVTTDSSGNVYVAGFQTNTGSYTYSAGVSVAGSSTGTNVVLVKYDNAGVGQWVKSISAGTGFAEFRSVAVDGSANIYAAGIQETTGSYTYSAGVSIAGNYSGNNLVLVKYDSSGVGQWARSVSTGGGTSQFDAVTTDSAGNIYAAGHQYTTGSYTYGAGVSVAGAMTNMNPVLVKYNSSGVAQWAKSVTVGASHARFNGVATDSTGNIYTAGYQATAGTYTYGTGVSVAGTNTVGTNVVVVKYNSSGDAQWVKSVMAGVSASTFFSVAADGSGNIYAGGFQNDTGNYTYSTGVTIAGTHSGNNAMLVKY